ncbi:MAG: hypothetical protein L3V56_04790 [Candidatus Magnetoovum sp. WYHC-5]|nr:hypothetical protein [Candidatus Magnetoovum sp. WYHC-5]
MEQKHIDRKSIRAKNATKGQTVVKTICINKECQLREVGCKGFDGCPGYKTI